MREIEDNTVPWGFAYGRTSTIRKGKAEFRGVDGEEHFLGGKLKGIDV